MADQRNQSAFSDRHVYLSNIPCDITKADLLEALGEGGHTAIQSMEWVPRTSTGEHVGNCIVEFASVEAARLAVQDIMQPGSPVMLGHHGARRELRASSNTAGRRSYAAPTTYSGPSGATRGSTLGQFSTGIQGNWRARNHSDTNEPSARQVVQGTGAGASSAQISSALASSPGTRVYIGHLSHKNSTTEEEAEIQELFTDYELISISTRRLPAEFTGLEGHEYDYYCVVEFANAEEAADAVERLNGVLTWEDEKPLLVFVPNSSRRIPP